MKKKFNNMSGQIAAAEEGQEIFHHCSRIFGGETFWTRIWSGPKHQLGLIFQGLPPSN